MPLTAIRPAGAFDALAAQLMPYRPPLWPYWRLRPIHRDVLGLSCAAGNTERLQQLAGRWIGSILALKESARGFGR